MLIEGKDYTAIQKDGYLIYHNILLSSDYTITESQATIPYKKFLINLFDYSKNDYLMMIAIQPMIHSYSELHFEEKIAFLRKCGDSSSYYLEKESQRGVLVSNPPIFLFSLNDSVFLKQIFDDHYEFGYLTIGLVKKTFNLSVDYALSELMFGYEEKYMLMEKYGMDVIVEMKSLCIDLIAIQNLMPEVEMLLNKK